MASLRPSRVRDVTAPSVMDVMQMDVMQMKESGDEDGRARRAAPGNPTQTAGGPPHPTMAPLRAMRPVTGSTSLTTLRRLRMHRLVITMGGTATLLALAACGSSPATATSTTPGSTATPGATGRGTRSGAAGQVAQINGTTLVLSTSSGDVNVTYDASTTMTKTRSGVLADITPGSCMVATGQKDATGALTVRSVRLSQPVNAACATGLGGRGPGGAGAGGAQGLSRSPAPGQPTLSVVAGKVTTASGTSITVQPATGPAQTVTVPTTLTVNVANPATASDLSVGECVQAVGPKSSSGTVTATSISIVPSGPSGCFTGGRGLGGGFGGGRGFGGGGTGAGAGA
jgi:Domain of unknown function (DUF5666)